MDTFSLNIEGEDILLYRFVYEPVKSNMFIFVKDKEAVVIDANDNKDGIRLLKEKGVNHVHLILTHEHFDHSVGVELFQEAFPSNELFCQEEAAVSISSPKGNDPKLVAFVLAAQDAKDGGHRYDDFKKNCKHYQLHADMTFGERADRELCGVHLHFLHTPGHSGGSSCIELGNYVFTGDNLLQNDPTILRFPESSKVVFRTVTLPYLQGLDKETVIFPGHGDPFKITKAKYLWD